VGSVILVLLPAGLGAIVYLGLAHLLRVEELDLIRNLVRGRLSRP
jgi:hypothetical protein